MAAIYLTSRQMLRLIMNISPWSVTVFALGVDDIGRSDLINKSLSRTGPNSWWNLSASGAE